jgi:uncharacterized membrane protein
MTEPSPASAHPSLHNVPPTPEKSQVNVAPTERLVSTIGGGLLTVYGLARGVGRRSPAGLLAAAAGGALLYRGVTGHCPAYEAAGVNTAGRTGPILIRETITIGRSRRDLYDTCRDFGRLPLFMQYLESVRVLDDRRSHWQARLPGIGTLAWEAEITEERPEELLAWRSLPGSDLEETGSLRFLDAPGGRGTEMHVAIDYRPPAGTPGTIVDSLSNPVISQLFREELRRFKNVMETGEVPSVAGQSAGH